MYLYHELKLCYKVEETATKYLRILLEVRVCVSIKFRSNVHSIWYSYILCRVPTEKKKKLIIDERVHFELIVQEQLVLSLFLFFGIFFSFFFSLPVLLLRPHGNTIKDLRIVHGVTEYTERNPEGKKKKKKMYQQHYSRSTVPTVQNSNRNRLNKQYLRDSLYPFHSF